MADLYDRLYGTAGAIPGLERTSPAFRTKVEQVANRLKMDPQDLLAVMSFETGGTFDPAVRNRAGSGATGLIQFMPKTARSLGTTTDALARMRPEEQLDYVEHYLRPYAGRMHTPQDAYMAVLYPQAVGKPPEHVLFQQGTRAYEQNKGLDQGQTGRVTIGDTMRTVGRFVQGMATPASAEAAPVSPARSATPGDRGEALYQRLYGTTPAAQAPAPEPAATVPSATMYQRLYGTQPQGPVPAPTPAAGPSAPPQTFQGDWRAQITAQQQAMGTQEAGRLQAERAVGSPTTTPWANVSDIGRTLAATGVSAGSAGAGAAIGGAIGGPIGAGLGAIGGSYLGRRLNVLGGLEEQGPLGDVVSIALPAGQVLYGAGKAGLRGLVARSRGWKAVEQADEATAAAQQAYQEGTEAAARQTIARRAQAQTQQQARDAAYAQRVQRQQQTAFTRHQQAEASRAQQVAERQASAAQEAAAKTQQQALDYAEQVQRYEQAVASQRQAVTQAQAIPQRYAPETPAHVLYTKVADIAPDAPVTLVRTQEVAAELQDVLGHVPSLQPSRMQALLTDMRAARSTQSVREVQRYLSDIGTLTRSRDSATRRTAKQLYGALHDDLAESATRLPATEAARDLLLQANATFRREMATRDLSRVISRAITVGDDGIARLAPGRALTQFDRLVEGDQFFAGSYAPEALAQIRTDLAGLTTAQKIPPRPGAAPEPVIPRAAPPPSETAFVPPALPSRPAPYTSWRPDVAGPPPPVPVLPTLEPREAGALRNVLRGAGLLDFLGGGANPVALVAGTLEAKEQIATGIAKLIVDPRFRPYMQHLLNLDGSINTRALMALAGGRAAVMRERKTRR